MAMTRKRGRIFRALVLTAVVLCFSTAGRGVSAAEVVLKVYGPGGPAAPMKECAELFGKKFGIRVEVTAGPESQWLDKARQDADVIYGGAEYMLTQFAMNYSCLVDGKTRTSLYVRPSGILVRKGNPKNIRSLADLAKSGIRLLDVNGAGQIGMWEDMAGRLGLIEGIRRNILVSVATSADAIEKWRTMPEIDAWITFESWHYRLKEDTDLVRLPENERVYRGTPVVATNFVKNREFARLFIDFLKSEECHAVFRKWGWK